MSNLSLPKPVTGTVNSVNGKTGTVTLSTIDVPESTNQYFTNARSRSAISLSLVSHNGTLALSALNAGISYNSSTGVVTISAEDNTNTAHTFVLRNAGGGIQVATVTAPQGTIDTLSVQDLTITNSLIVPSNVLISGGLNILGPVITNDIVAAASLSASGAIVIDGDATIGGTLTTNGTIVSNAAIACLGNLTTSSVLTVNGGAQFQGINGILYASDFQMVSAAVTDNLPESVTPTNLWHTTPRVVKTPVTGLTLDGSLSGKVTTTDNLSAAFSRIQTTLNQLSALVLSLGKTV